jgi:hypothetical protein
MLMEEITLAVNGSLMRGFSLNDTLLSVDAQFVREAQTSDGYRMWSINDQYPAMQRVQQGGNHIQVEIWSLTPSALVQVLDKEPPGLCMGKIELQDKQWVFGILGEDYIRQDMQEITRWGGWRNFQSQLTK